MKIYATQEAEQLFKNARAEAIRRFEGNTEEMKTGTNSIQSLPSFVALKNNDRTFAARYNVNNYHSIIGG